jgi:glutamate synthase (NADPH/NADH) small chain
VDGRVTTLRGVEVSFERDSLNRPLMPSMETVPGSEFEMPADLVLLAMGFLGPVQQGLVEGLAVDLDPRGNIQTNLGSYATSEPGVFACGDCRRGQSLVVWAQWEGREAARAADAYLSGGSHLQARNEFV